MKLVYHMPLFRPYTLYSHSHTHTRTVEPHWGQIRRNAKDKHGGDWANKLAKERDGEHIWMSAANFYPGADAIKSWPNQDDIPDPPVVQEPEDGQDERDVSEKVHHGQPVNGQRVNVVETHKDVANNAVLEPHEGIAGWDGAEEKQHEPAAVVQFGLELGDQLPPVAVQSLRI